MSGSETGSETGRRLALALLLAVATLAAAGGLLWSLTELQARLSEERFAFQGDAIAESVAKQVDAGVPFRDVSGVAASVRSLLSAEPSLIRVALLDSTGAVSIAVGDPVPEAARTLEREIRSRNPQSSDYGRMGALRLVFAPPEGPRIALLDGVALAGVLGLALIGAIYFLYVADRNALRGRAAGRAWMACVAAPALALAVWLAVATGEIYRDRAQAAADVIAARLRAAVDIGIDPLSFTGLDGMLREAGLGAGGRAAAYQFALFEGRRPVYGLGVGSVGALLEPRQLDLTAGRSVRPRTLEAPALAIVGRVNWDAVLRRAPEDHPAALAAVLIYVFAPAALLTLTGRRRA